jgi:diadenosine tetraphosphate (Ap4A) HIT family hydrolase
MRKDCPLCCWQDDPDQHRLCGTDTVLFLQNERRQGPLIGSGVIVPTRHADTVFDLTPEEVQATFTLLADVKARLDRQYQPDGYTLGWNCGAVGGQEIMHAHLHVIPRFRQEPYAGRGLRYWFKQDENRWR